MPVVAASTLALQPLARGARDLDPEDMLSGLELVRSCGATHVDLTDTWLPVATLTDGDLGALRRALALSGLVPTGISVVRHSILDPADAQANLVHTRRAIALAAALGAPVVSIGFHESLPPRALAVPFWSLETELGPRADPLPLIRRLADEAASDHVAISLELYEGGPLGSGHLAVELVERVGKANVGINLDVGNLYRSPLSVQETWLECVQTCLPLTNYWHVKNYRRIHEHPSGRMVGSIACSLPDGDIDYRRCLAEARAVDYQGPLIVEQYGGDGIAAQRGGVAYLLGMLEDWDA